MKPSEAVTVSLNDVIWLVKESSTVNYCSSPKFLLSTIIKISSTKSAIFNHSWSLVLGGALSAPGKLPKLSVVIATSAREIDSRCLTPMTLRM